jgi:hypothetical protein
MCGFAFLLALKHSIYTSFATFLLRLKLPNLFFNPSPSRPPVVLLRLISFSYCEYVNVVPTGFLASSGRSFVPLALR